MSKQKRTWDVILAVVMVLLCLLWIYPIVLILLNSLKTEGSFTTSTVFRPVSYTHLEQGGSLALLHLAHQGGLVLAGSGGDNGHRHAGLLGVLSGQILPILILLGLPALPQRQTARSTT